MDTSDKEFLDELNDLVDTALDAVQALILERRTEVMSYNSNGVPNGMTKSNTVSVEDIKAAIAEFKIENRK